MFAFQGRFKKAYDYVSWGFLFSMMERMCFDARCIEWMQDCVCERTMAVLVNGSPTVDFKVHKGLR